MERREVNLDGYIKKLDKLIRHKFSKDSCHDIYHLYRVYNLSLKIQKIEGGDRLIIGVGAFLHDLHRIMQLEQKKYVTPKESLPVVRNLLINIKFPINKIDQILKVVEFHEEYSFTKKGKTFSNKEILIVQDADNLDAMGALGFARTFTFAAIYNEPIYNPEFPLTQGYYDDSKKEVSALHHFYNKLLRLKDNMNTMTAKKLAVERHKYMQDFIKQFLKEWNSQI